MLLVVVLFLCSGNISVCRGPLEKKKISPVYFVKSFCSPCVFIYKENRGTNYKKTPKNGLCKPKNLVPLYRNNAEQKEQRSASASSSSSSGTIIVKSHKKQAKKEPRPFGRGYLTTCYLAIAAIASRIPLSAATGSNDGFSAFSIFPAQSANASSKRVSRVLGVLGVDSFSFGHA